MPGRMLPADAAQVLHVVQQRVDERAVGFPAAGCTTMPGRLVDDDDVGSSKRTSSGMSWAAGGGGRRLREFDGNHVAFAHCAVGLDCLTREQTTWPSSISRWICDRE